MTKFYKDKFKNEKFVGVGSYGCVQVGEYDNHGYGLIVLNVYTFFWHGAHFLFLGLLL